MLWRPASLDSHIVIYPLAPALRGEEQQQNNGSIEQETRTFLPLTTSHSIFSLKKLLSSFVKTHCIHLL